MVFTLVVFCCFFNQSLCMLQFIGLYSNLSLADKILLPWMVVIVFLRAYKVEWSQTFLHIHRNTRVIILPITLMRLLAFGEFAKVTRDLCSTWCIWLKERKCVCVCECVYAVVCCDRGRKGSTVKDGRDNHPPSALLFFSLLLAFCFYIQLVFYISGIFRLTYLTKNFQWVSRL